MFDGAGAYTPIIATVNQVLSVQRVFKLVGDGQPTSVYYSVDVLRENEALNQVVGLSAPRDLDFEMLLNNEPYLFFRVVLSPSANCEQLQVIKIKFTRETLDFSNVFLMPEEILYQADSRYTVAFKFYRNSPEQGLGENDSHIVTADIPYKLSCSNGELNVLGDNNLATPYVFSSDAQGTIEPFEFTFKTHEYGRQCFRNGNEPSSMSCSLEELHADAGSSNLLYMTT